MTARTSFRGSFTALVTPFANGTLDEKAFRGLVDWQIAEGTDGLVPVGTTGESPTLSHEEHGRVVEWCVAQAKGRVPVVAGAGSNSTAEAIAFRSRFPGGNVSPTELTWAAKTIPPIAAIAPEIAKTMTRMRETLIPARRAASAFPPMA